MESLTPLQNAIVNVCSYDDSVSNPKLASRLGCSTDYVGEIRRRYSNEIQRFSYKINPYPSISIARPYEFFLRDTHFDNLDLEKGDPIKLQFIINGERYEYWSKAQMISDIDRMEESRCLIYGLNNSPEDHKDPIPSEIFEPFSPNKQNEGIYSTDGLENSIQKLKREIDTSFDKADCIIGAGIYEHFLEGDGENRVQTPNYYLSTQSLASFFDNVEIVLYNLTTTSQEIPQPDPVYFLAHSGSVSDDNKEKLINEISNVKYFSRRLYNFGNLIAYGPLLSENPSEIFEVTEESLEIVPESARMIQSLDKDIEYTNIKNIVESLSFNDANTGEDVNVKISSHSDYNIIRVQIFPMAITILVRDSEITFLYHVEAPNFDQTVSEIISAITSDVDFEAKVTEPLEAEHTSDFDPGKWVFDTNSIYHQIISDEACSILHTILPNIELYDTDMIIPWSTIYEINKHKNTDSAGSSVRQQGIDNINTMRKLDEYDFLNLEIEKVPEEPKSGLEESALADMFVLGSAQSNEAALFTSDQDLQQLSEASGVHTVDIREVAMVEPDVEPYQSLWENVESEFDTGPLRRDQLVEVVVQQVQEETAKTWGSTPKPDPKEQARDYIHEWVKKDLIMPFESEGAMSYSTTREFNVVPTYDLISHISDHVTDENYLDGVFLDKLRGKYGLGKSERPLLNFCIPTSYVIQAQSECSTGKIEGTLQSLLYLTSIENANYSPVEITDKKSGTLVEDAIAAAKQKDCLLLCRDGDKNLDKLSELLGVTVKKLVSR